MKDDDALITSYLEGDATALEELVARYLTSVYRLALWLTNNPEAAEDISQEAFVKAWKHVRTYRLGTDFEAWLFGITRNTAIDWLRKRKEVPLSAFETPEGANALLEVTPDTADSAETLLEKAQDEVFVMSLIEKLDPKYRRVIQLRLSRRPYVQGNRPHPRKAAPHGEEPIPARTRALKAVCGGIGRVKCTKIKAKFVFIP